jgi:hypothetical protein
LLPCCPAPCCCAADILKFYGCELGAQTNFDKNTGTSIVNGAHDQKKLSELLEAFIKKYVQCYSCGNPETMMKIKKEFIYLKCKACGYVSDVDMRHKVNTFILKNPPENKLSKEERRCVPPQLLTSTPAVCMHRFSWIVFGSSCWCMSESCDSWCRCWCQKDCYCSAYRCHGGIMYSKWACKRICLHLCCPLTLLCLIVLTQCLQPEEG